MWTDTMITEEALWELALAHPVFLFRTLSEGSLLAVFDEKGFSLSQEAQQIYKPICSLPHVYTARLETENAYYFGISNQSGGRWKRSQAYHLRGLACEILGTKRYDDQNHSRWVREWFQFLEPRHRGSYYEIPMKEKVVTSFFVPQPRASRAELRGIESLLISMARRRDLIVLNERD